MKRWLTAGWAAALIMLLSGCMYPNDLRMENQLATGEFIVVVQNAVDQYKAKTGVLPIKNSELTTPLYEKYPIDFKKLKGAYMSDVPANAFEKGGTSLYVLVDVETKPKVKMMDLVSFQAAVDLQSAVDTYKAKNGGALPLGEPVAKGFHTVDFDKLNRKAMDLQSMYSRNVRLPFLLHDSGQVAIDYAPEIMRLIDKKQLQSKLAPNQELRELLVEESYFVPARSYAYRWSGGQPIPITAP